MKIFCSICEFEYRVIPATGPETYNVDSSRDSVPHPTGENYDRKAAANPCMTFIGPSILNVLELSMSISATTLKKLAEFDTPTICNVIELFDVRPYTAGYMDQSIRSSFPGLAPMVGYLVTTTFTAQYPSGNTGTYGSFSDQLELIASAPGPAVMVFQDVDEPPIAATFGEVMCSTYQAFGAAGLITSGAGRDIEQIRALRFPVFTSSAICSHGYGRWLNIGKPVRVGGLTVECGELLHGDANGVTTIPLEIAAEVADAAQEFLAAEEIILNYNKTGDRKSIAEFSDRRAASVEAIARLKERISRNRQATCGTIR
jgi:4-hydroxy-4-methyl-2-oxoglutarate aldolase